MTQPLGLVIHARDATGRLHAEAAVARDGRALLLACGTPEAPTCWMELDVITGAVQHGNFDPRGYVVQRPTNRWNELKVLHRDRPQFCIDVRVLQ